MPQMSPMWWSTLFMMFLLTFMLFMVTMYFFKMYKISVNKKSFYKNTKNINWKW